MVQSETLFFRHCSLAGHLVFGMSTGAEYVDAVSDPRDDLAALVDTFRHQRQKTYIRVTAVRPCHHMCPRIQSVAAEYGARHCDFVDPEQSASSIKGAGPHPHHTLQTHPAPATIHI